MNWELKDAQDNVLEAARKSLSEDVLMIYEARGCDYEFEFYNDSPSEDGMGAAVYCFSYNGEKDGELVWSGCTHIGPETRVIDAVRSARKAHKMS